MNSQELCFNKNNPFYASISQRYNLCRVGSEKNTYHIVLDLKGSGITYQVGDSIAVYGQNDPEIIKNTLQYLKAVGSEKIIDKQGAEWSLKEFLTKKCNLNDVPRKLIIEIFERQINAEKKEHFKELLLEQQKEALKEYISRHELWDVLAENQEVGFTPQEFCSLLMPLLPRFYSIASSQNVVGEEVHLTVSELVYETNNHIRRGVCTHYLCQLVPFHEPIVPVYIQSSNGFSLPTNTDIPIIMIGPGTGIAPFRAFMQERQQLAAKGANWLFFGERHQDFEFLYEDYWSELVMLGKLCLQTAFSRDQEHKIYVQHRMMEQGSNLFSLLESGAYLYVCGDAHRMAKDVDAALHQIVQIHGKFSEIESKNYVKDLKAAKRYLRDVY